MLRQQLADRFSDIRSRQVGVTLFSNPFDVSAEDASDAVQMELIEIQCSADLKTAFT